MLRQEVDITVSIAAASPSPRGFSSHDVARAQAGKRTLLDAHQCARHQAAYIDNDRFARIRGIRVARLSEPQKPVKEGEKVLGNEAAMGQCSGC